MAESASSSSVVASLRALLTSLLQRAWTWVVRSTTQLQDSLVSLLLDFLSCLHAVQEHLPEPGTLTTGNTVFGSEVRYRLNSVYDPSYAVGGRSVHNY